MLWYFFTLQNVFSEQKSDPNPRKKRISQQKEQEERNPFTLALCII
jgi:hypothetical protein